MASASQIQIEHCPPATDFQPFDQHQFYDRRNHAVSAETGISFSDYDKMHVFRRCNRGRFQGECPAWATNDKLTREVVCRYAEHRLYISLQPEKSYEARMETVARESARLIEVQQRELDDAFASGDEEWIQQIDTKTVVLQRGIIAIAASVVYSYYRLGESSTQIAEKLGLRPPHVRVMLWRMRKIAAEIQTGKLRWFDQPTRQRQRSTRRRRRSIEFLEEMWNLRLGNSFARCGQLLGMSETNVRYHWRRFDGEFAAILRRTRSKQ